MADGNQTTTGGVASGIAKRKRVLAVVTCRALVVAGGWALDLFVVVQSRPHRDLDNGVLRRDVLEVLSALRSWKFFEAKGGVLTRLREGEARRAV
jgi:hypothetical protein